MIIIVTKLQLRRGYDYEIPGRPNSAFPPYSWPQGLDVSEIGFTKDSSRFFIGHDPKPVDLNYKRVKFPYQNVEILTETSPRNEELFNHFVRNQDINAFYEPTIIEPSYTGPITYSDVTNSTIVPSRMNGTTLSAVFDYHVFSNSIVSTAYTPLQNGILRVLAGEASSIVTDNQNITRGSTVVTFAVGPPNIDQYGLYYLLNITNLTSSPILLYLRRVEIEVNAIEATTVSYSVGNSEGIANAFADTGSEVIISNGNVAYSVQFNFSYNDIFTPTSNQLICAWSISQTLDFPLNFLGSQSYFNIDDNYTLSIMLNSTQVGTLKSNGVYTTSGFTANSGDVLQLIASPAISLSDPNYFYGSILGDIP